MLKGILQGVALVILSLSILITVIFIAPALGAALTILAIAFSVAIGLIGAGISIKLAAPGIALIIQARAGAYATRASAGRELYEPDFTPRSDATIRRLPTSISEGEIVRDREYKLYR
jgi:hypothetical protein